MGAVKVIVADEEFLKIFNMFALNFFNEGLWSDPFQLCLQHGTGAVGVIGTDVGAAFSAQTLKTNPDIGLHVLQKMTKVNRAIGVRQGTGDKYLSGFAVGLFHEQNLVADKKLLKKRCATIPS